MTNNEIKLNNERINIKNLIDAYNLELKDYDLLSSIITYTYTQDYDLLLESIKSYLLNNKKLSYKEYRTIALSMPIFE